MAEEQYAFEQIHIDIARNSTDDFNPFHDPLRWNNIRGNPFAGPIALGFQLEFLCSDRIMRQRATEGHGDDSALPWRNFEFNFAGALRVGERCAVDARKTIDKRDRGGGLSNRAVVRKSDGSPVLIGTQSDTADPRVTGIPGTAELPDVSGALDRRFLADSGLFLKRKFMTTSNAKNFALGALCRQHDYIDELAERIEFPPLFTAALVSCALLEHGLAQGHDFEAAPLVYTSHQIAVDMRVQRRLRSNDAVHMLVSPPETVDPGQGLGKACVRQHVFNCTALVGDGSALFHARVQLAPLDALTAAAEVPPEQEPSSL